MRRVRRSPGEVGAEVKIGVPREVKADEDRVAVTPAGVHELIRHGHDVLVEAQAGAGSALDDDDYAAAGAAITRSATDVWAHGDLILKVKEPVPAEYPLLREGQTLFTFLHLAADAGLTEELCRRGVVAVGYETVQLADGSLPLLAPMSLVAGRLAAQIGAHHLMSPQGGRGVLLGGVPGVKPADVVILGGGVVGTNAAAIALGLRAQVTVLSLGVGELRRIDDLFQGRCRTVAANAHEIESAVVGADLVIGAALVPGAKAPRLVRSGQVARMKPGSVLVDVSIDQGGCFEDSRPTTHSEPTFRVHDSVFYCVSNIPGAVPHTSTYALANVTLPYALALAERGWRDAMAADPALAEGLNVAEGAVVNEAVARAHGLRVWRLADVLGFRG